MERRSYITTSNLVSGYFDRHAPVKLHQVSIILVNIGTHRLDKPQRFLLKLLNRGKCNLWPHSNQWFEFGLELEADELAENLIRCIPCLLKHPP